MSKTKNRRWPRIRKFFNDLHLWMGLGSGLIVIVVCFSGTAYVFNTELKEMASPELYEISEVPDSDPLTAEEIIQKVQEHTQGTVQSLKIPHDRSRTWHVAVRTPSESAPARGPGAGRPNMGTTYAVNPYTGEVVGNVSAEKNGVTEFMRAMFSLHRWLLLDRVEEPIFGELPNRKLGSYITGTATILFTLGVLTGLIIWFPQKIKSWRQGFKIKWNAKWKRVNHDLHNALGFYSLIFLFLMGVTGPQWSFPWYREGLQKTLGTYQSPDARPPEAPKSVLPIDVSQTQKPTLAGYLFAAGEVLAYDGDYTLVLPRDSVAAISVSKVKTGFFSPAAGDRVFLDQYTAEVLQIDIFKDRPFNERVAGSIKALHLGDVYGKFTKILYFFACLVATSLPVTGTLIWIHKLKKKRRKSARGQLVTTA